MTRHALCSQQYAHPSHYYDLGNEKYCPGKASTMFVTKDSGKREEYDSGMVRDTQEGKPRFDLLFPKGIPYKDQFLTRVAELLARGVEKYGERNWELAASDEEINRFGGSGLRHNIQEFCGETDEDHAAAVVFNLLAKQSTKWKMEHPNDQG